MHAILPVTLPAFLSFFVAEFSGCPIFCCPFFPLGKGSKTKRKTMSVAHRLCVICRRTNCHWTAVVSLRKAARWCCTMYREVLPDCTFVLQTTASARPSVRLSPSPSDVSVPQFFLFTTIIGTVRKVCGKVCVMERCPSVHLSICLSQLLTTAVVCSGFAVLLWAQQATDHIIAAQPAPSSNVATAALRSAAKATSVTFTAAIEGWIVNTVVWWVFFVMQSYCKAAVCAVILSYHLFLSFCLSGCMSR